MKTVYRLILISFFSLIAYGCNNLEQPLQNNETTFQNISKSKIVRVGYIVYPPIVTKDVNSGNLGGHFVDTINEIAKQSNWKVEFIETDWSGFTAGLKSKRFDISIAPTFTTIPRLTSVSFTEPLIYAGNSAIALKSNNRFSSIEDLNSEDVTIAVTQGEAGHEYAKANLQKAKLIIHPGPDQLLTFQDVLTGRADVALGDAFVTAKFASQHPDKISDVFSKNPYNLTPVSWSVRYGDIDLLNFLNNSISVLSTQGKLQEFEKRAGANWLHKKVIWTFY